MKLKPRASTQHMAMAAKYMRGLGDSTRLAILRLLQERGKMCVSEIVQALGDVPQARVSDHLACLKWCHYVEAEREGKFVFYYVMDPRVVELLRLVEDLAAQHADQLASCGRLQEAE